MENLKAVAAHHKSLNTQQSEPIHHINVSTHHTKLSGERRGGCVVPGANWGGKDQGPQPLDGCGCLQFLGVGVTVAAQFADRQ